ncbi:MAG: hypothetical protein GX285_07310 [Clostridiales bacterium]|nr:hypothetical protein [Clostridiales bacterium]
MVINSLNSNNYYGYNLNNSKQTNNISNENKTESQNVKANSVEGKEFERVEDEPCQTCARRKYVDGSNDLGVSFKAGAHISPESAASAVRAHEYEHVGNRRAEAMREGKEIISQSVQIHTSVCPECGKTYVSGGTTRTLMAGKSQFVDKGSFVDKYA